MRWVFVVVAFALLAMPLVFAHEERIEEREERARGMPMMEEMMECRKVDAVSAVERALERDGLKAERIVISTEGCFRGHYQAVALILLADGSEIKAEVEGTPMETKVRIMHPEERKEEVPTSPPVREETVLVKVLANGKPVVAVGFSVDEQGVVNAISLGEVLKLARGKAYIAAVGFPLSVIDLESNTVVDLVKGTEVQPTEPGFKPEEAKPVEVVPVGAKPKPKPQPLQPVGGEELEEVKKEDKVLEEAKRRGYIVKDQRVEVVEKGGEVRYRVRVVKPGKILGIVPMPLFDKEVVVEFDDAGNVVGEIEE